MPQILVHLHPVEPVSGEDFSDYLSGLTITARDISFEDQDGELIGQASYDPDLDESTIIQHVRLDVPAEIPEPAATAHIEIDVPPDRPEHASVDVILEVRRDDEIIERSVHYNVPVYSSALSEVDSWSTEPAAYVALPSAGVGLDPDAPFVDLPTDGSPPRFDQLRAAVEAVLANDPGPGEQPELSRLTPEQCDHLALELLANRERKPLPEPPRPLGRLHRPTDSTTIETERERFEGELLAHRSTLETQAIMLSRYIFTMSAALDSEDRSQQAEEVRFEFPVRPAAEDDASLVARAEVVLTD